MSSSMPCILQEKLSNTWIHFFETMANRVSPFTADISVKGPASHRKAQNSVVESWELVLSILEEVEAVEIDRELKFLPVFLSLSPILQLRFMFCVQSNLTRKSSQSVLSFLEKIDVSENSFWMKDAVHQLRSIVTQCIAGNSKLTGESTTKYEFTSESQRAVKEMLCRLREGRRWPWQICSGSPNLTAEKCVVTEVGALPIIKIASPSKFPHQSEFSMDIIIIDEDSIDTTTTKNHSPILTVRPDMTSIGKNKFGNGDMTKFAGTECFKTQNKENITELSICIPNTQSLVNKNPLSVVFDVTDFNGNMKDKKRKFSEIAKADDLSKMPVRDRKELMSAKIVAEPGNISNGDVSLSQVKQLNQPADSETKLSGNILVCLDSIRESCSSSNCLVKDVTECFVDMDSSETKLACDYLSLSHFSEKALVNFCDSLPWASLGFDNSMILLDSCFRLKLTNMETQASQMLMMSLGSVSKIQPKALISVLVHIVQETHSNDFQCRVLASSCRDFFVSDCHGYLIRKLSTEHLVLNEHLVGVLQTLLDKRADLDEDAVTYFHSLITTATLEVSSRPKFGKLLLGFLTKYVKKMSSQQLITLTAMVVTHSSSFRKPLLTLVKHFT